ncbi:MAG: metal-sensitive transcriptional regulator [Halanaerobiaceae bacterium]
MNSLTEEDKNDLLLRLRRIEGQIRGLQRMIKEDKYCVDILTQINASRGALKKVALNILDNHIHGCVQRSLKEENGEEIIDELMEVLEKYTD